MELNLAGIDKDWLDKLISSHNIITVVSRYVPLNRKGHNYWGRCPFHHEKTPSFAVDEDRQFYHCFGCGESGDVIKFVQKIENIDFMESVSRLADEIKLEIPSYKLDNEIKALKEKRDKILALNRIAAVFYHKKLLSEEGKQAYEYLINRGITDRAIKKFALGYSPNFNQLVEFLTTQGHIQDDLVTAGLCAKNKDGKYYDVFGGRLIIPIINNFNEVIGFGGRSLVSTDFAKYRNTSATIVFDKSKTIYAINELKKAKHNAKLDYIILCEGYMDVIAMQMAGYNTAVASMGTSLTNEQAKTLHRYAPLVYICYDGDAAGQKATLRGLDILEENGLEVKVIVLPEGLDPDDVVKKEGAEGFKNQYLEKALPLMKYKLEVLKKDFDLKSEDGKSKYAVRAVAEASKQKDYVSIEATLKIIQNITGYTFESLNAQLNMSVEGVRPILVEEKQDNLQSKAIKYLLWAIINNKDYAHKDFRLDKLPINDFHKSIFSYARSNKDIKKIYLEFDESVHNELGEILVFGEQYSQDPIVQKQYYDGYYAQLLLEVLEQDIAQLSKEYEVETEEKNKRAILDELKKQIDKINQIKTKGV